jgi:hypothetical protein
MGGLGERDNPQFSAKHLYLLRNWDAPGKYTVADKFALIASLLSLETAEADLNDFKVIQKIRNLLLHGEDFNEDTLPVEMTQNVLRKYLALHLVA